MAGRNSLSPDQDSNTGPPKYEAGDIIHYQCPLCCVFSHVYR